MNQIHPHTSTYIKKSYASTYRLILLFYEMNRNKVYRTVHVQLGYLGMRLLKRLKSHNFI